MTTILRTLIAVGVILDGALGFGFLSDPAGSALGFGVSANGAMGLSSLRADFTAFFLVAAGFMAAGAWKLRGDVLVAPLALFLVALTGRALNLMIVGPYPAWWQPMAVETLHVVVLASAIGSWSWRGSPAS